MSAAIRLSPLAHRSAIAAEDGETGLSERPFLGKFILRIDAGAGGSAVKSALECDLPVTAGGTAAGPSVAVLWLAPDEWLVVTDPGAERAVSDALAPAFKDMHHQISDVGDYYTTLELAGTQTRHMLSKLTPLDLHASAFPSGRCAGSVFGKANAWLHCRQDDAEAGAVFDIHIRWSMADYLWCVLAEAGREFGFPEQVPIGKVPLRS